MSREANSGSSGVGPAAALAFSGIGFVALAICGLGIASLVTNTDVITTRGLGQIPGVVGFVGALAGWAGATWVGLRRTRPSFFTAGWACAAGYLAYIFVTGIAAAIAVADTAVGGSVAAALAVGWPGGIIAFAAFIASWSAIALVRTRAQPPQWPWER
ncbi:hypothetical protein FHX48_002736 [Microbacterium halimionae]|uniref:Uncharacterized protein n=1 Tax=Microbacterium halimionae TaxID=1526413 RepID=A0A7W3PMG9_9MICO|nr:hypothetical protein [Microbacterium halimionae]MBA8816914.1 hypothetical protein [Microbacterium halimionae]MBA8817631.1 hypothetical protein [Microbacterium halimionae]NII94790.1 hypothetical protein [Microbacterium halimionae]